MKNIIIVNTIIINCSCVIILRNNCLRNNVTYHILQLLYTPFKLDKLLSPNEYLSKNRI